MQLVQCQISTSKQGHSMRVHPLHILGALSVLLFYRSWGEQRSNLWGMFSWRNLRGQAF